MIKKLILALAFSSAASATPITADQQWHPFDVDEAYSSSGSVEWIDLDGNPLSFEFVLTQPAWLTVIDGGFSGDRFRIYDHGTLLGETSSALSSYPVSVGLDFDSAYANNAFSRGMFWLASGSHSITGVLSQSALDNILKPINATVGAVRLTSVPLPGGVGLFLGGVAWLFALRRKA